MHEARKSGRPSVANEKKQIIVQMLDSGMLGGGSVGGDGAIDAAVPGPPKQAAADFTALATPLLYKARENLPPVE